MFKPLTLLTLTTVFCLGAVAASRDEAGANTGDSAEGFWVATAPSGVHVKWGVLDNGDTWGLYDREGTILGAFHGSTRSSQGVLHGTGQAFDIPSRTVGATSFTGTYVPRQAISITTSHGVGFSGRYVAGYDQPARLSELAGRFDGEGLSSLSPVHSMGLRVDASGAVALSSDHGCTASGTATPRPGGKNVFNMALQFAGSGCALGHGTTVSGIAHFSTASGELFVLAMNAARTDGWLYLGARVGE
ncbi:MAG: hypothetical protein Q8K50_08600 [Hydrogenophaga sp.]|nr:hypothetical protein [Hydrogenophaga sp.]MDP3925001.1 hypothetical protein [Hydrogenophaga sp.]